MRLPFFKASPVSSSFPLTLRLLWSSALKLKVKFGFALRDQVSFSYGMPARILREINPTRNYDHQSCVSEGWNLGLAPSSYGAKLERLRAFLIK